MAEQFVHPNNNLDPDYILVEHVTMTQLSTKAGLKRWKKPAEKAITKELHQLHHHDFFEPMNLSNLTKEEYDGTFESLLFLKQKRDDSIKGWMVKGGDK